MYIHICDNGNIPTTVNENHIEHPRMGVKALIFPAHNLRKSKHTQHVKVCSMLEYTVLSYEAYIFTLFCSIYLVCDPCNNWHCFSSKYTREHIKRISSLGKKQRLCNETKKVLTLEKRKNTKFRTLEMSLGDPRISAAVLNYLFLFHPIRVLSFEVSVFLNCH